MAELGDALVRRPERFVTTMTEKPLTYAFGRGLTHADLPAVRRILRETADGGYRLQSTGALGGAEVQVGFLRVRGQFAAPKPLPAGSQEITAERNGPLPILA